MGIPQTQQTILSARDAVVAITVESYGQYWTNVPLHLLDLLAREVEHLAFCHLLTVSPLVPPFAPSTTTFQPPQILITLLFR